MNRTTGYIFTLAILCVMSAQLRAAEPETAWAQEIKSRRGKYLDWIVERFTQLEPDMKPHDGRGWSLNQARLFLGRDTNKANRYFESVTLTADPDFMGVRLLKTLLDFGDSDRLSARAKENLSKTPARISTPAIVAAHSAAYRRGDREVARRTTRSPDASDRDSRCAAAANKRPG